MVFENLVHIKPFLSYNNRLDMNLAVAVVNVRSLRNKVTSFLEHVVKSKLDLVIVTETWLTDYDEYVIGEIKASGYNFFSYPRPSRDGGGIGLLHRKNIKVVCKQHGELKSFEYAQWLVTCSNTTFMLHGIYRPTYSTAHPVTTKTFFKELHNYLDVQMQKHNNIVLGGDFNIHVNIEDDNDAEQLADITEAYGLTQHVWQQTHESGNTLDLLYTKFTDPIQVGEILCDTYISDHCFVKTTLSVQKPPLIRKQVCSRRLKDINHELFTKDLQKAVDACGSISTVSEMVNEYNTRLSAILNVHAPLVKKTVTCRETYPWYTPEIQQLKRAKRIAERKWLHSRNFSDLTDFKQIRNKYLHCLNTTKDTIMRQKVVDCNGDYGKLFRVVKSCVGNTGENLLPEGEDKDIANQFATFFNDKIARIRSDLQHYPLYQANGHCTSSLNELRILEEKEVHELIMKSKTTSCGSDPIPTSLVKKHLTVLLPFMTRIINESLKTGEFPCDWKHSMIRPLLKKPSLDKDTLSNYRPVSNLAFMSKLAEKAALRTLSKYLDDYHLMPEYQSAYRPFHSTETSLLKLTNDVLCNMEQRKVTLLVAVDLSAAFDTVDHTVLQDILHSRFGIDNTALEWFRSYLADRDFRVFINDTSSDAIDLPFSVPQGSVAGPILYSLYASSLSDVIPPDINISGYADDHSFYTSFKPGSLIDQTRCIDQMEDLLLQVNNWMCINRLKMNNSKTEAILFGSSYFLDRTDIDHINVCGTDIELSQCIKQLGVKLDNTLSFKEHVKNKCKTANFSLFQIRKIRKYLSQDTAKIITHALVISHLDFSNSLLYGLPDCTIHKLQTIQNQAAKVVLANWDISSSVALQRLHWLPVIYRIKFKILCLVFKCLYNMAPLYLSKLIHVKTFIYETKLQKKSKRGILLDIPFNKAKTFADRAFSVAGPREWNFLPDEIRSCDKLLDFRKKLKTHFYKLAFKA